MIREADGGFEVEPRATPKTEPGIFSPAYVVMTLSLGAVMFLTGFAALAVVPTLPVAARSLHGLSLYPLVAGCFVAASLLGGILGGNWADRAGAKRPLAVGIALAVASLLISATSVSIWQLAAGRFVDGIAGGMVAVCVTTAIGQTYPKRLRPRALALMSSAWIIPSTAGPPLAGLVTSWWSWRAVFFGLAVVNVLPALALAVLLHSGTRGPAAAGSRPPVAIAVTVSAGAAMVQFGASGRNPTQLLSAAIGLCALAYFAPGLLPPGTVRAGRGLPAVVLLRGLTSGVYFTLEAFVPLWLVTVRRVPATATGLAFTGATLAWAAASWAQAGPLRRFPRHHLISVGTLIMSLSIGTAVLGTLPGMPSYAEGVALVAAAIGMGLLVPSLTALSLTTSTADRQGYASSAMLTTQNLGQVITLALASVLFGTLAGPSATHPAGYTAAFALLGAPGVLAGVLAIRTLAPGPPAKPAAT